MKNLGCGYVVLANETTRPSNAEICAALDAAGWERWDGTGPPAIVVFHNNGPKGDYFEAGYWSGSGVPLFFLGGGKKRTVERKQIINRVGGWVVIGENGVAKLDDLIAAIDRWAAMKPMGAKRREARAVLA